MATWSSSGEGWLKRITSQHLVSNPLVQLEPRVFGGIIYHKNIKNTVVYNVLKVAWVRHSSVKMTEVDDKTTAFHSEAERDRDQIMNLSPWSVQGQCLNLKECILNICLGEIDFDLMQIWLQNYGLILDMYNTENTYRIGNNVGRCISVESDHVMQQRSFLGLKIEINIKEPLMAGVGWTNSKGQEK